jgi:hypothetical protein
MNGFLIAVVMIFIILILLLIALFMYIPSGNQNAGITQTNQLVTRGDKHLDSIVKQVDSSAIKSKIKEYVTLIRLYTTEVANGSTSANVTIEALKHKFEEISAMLYDSEEDRKELDQLFKYNALSFAQIISIKLDGGDSSNEERLLQDNMTKIANKIGVTSEDDYNAMSLILALTLKQIVNAINKDYEKGLENYELCLNTIDKLKCFDNRKC